MSTAKRTSIGLIGCGIWGRNILHELSILGHDVFVVDVEPATRKFAQLHGAMGAFADIDHLPAVDGLVVATPASTHADVVESALDKGVPIFVEKPLTDNVESARRIAGLAPDRIFVMHIWMYHPGVEKLAEIARDRALGEVNILYTARTNWTSPRTDVDIVWTALPHDISIAHAILGVLPEPASCVAESINGVTVGMVAVLGGPPHCVFNISARYRDKRREVRLHCADGVAVLPSGESSFIEISRGRELKPHTERLEVSPETALRRELRACMAYLKGGSAPRSGVEEGARVVEDVATLRIVAGLTS